jgi:hypothetical protein
MLIGIVLSLLMSACKLTNVKQVRFANMLETVMNKVEALAEAASDQGRRWTRLTTILLYYFPSFLCVLQ